MERYFLGNNSGYGFWNNYKEELQNKDRVALLKGGPGTGKSTLMKKVVSAVKKAGLDYELWYCSGDPSSLDGVYIKDLDRAVVDATAPHDSGVSIPIIKDRIFDLAPSLCGVKLQGKREEIENLSKCKKQCFSHAYQHLKCALCHFNNKLEIQKDAIDESAIRSYAHKICEVLRGEKERLTRGRKLFSSAICPSGASEYYDYLRKARIYLVEGCDRAKKVFFDEIAKLLPVCTLLQNPLEPHVYDGVLRGGIAVVSDAGHFEGEVSERISLYPYQKPYDDKDAVEEEGAKLTQTAFAVERLNEAREVHKQLEKIYIGAMDFERNEKVAREVTDFLLE